MSIRSIPSSSAMRPVAPAAAPATTAPATAAAKAKPQGSPPAAVTGGPRPRQDSVAISDDARARAAGSSAGTGATDGTLTARAPLTAQRVDELRKKVLEGAYNQSGVVDQVAKRILDRGDV